MGEDTRVLRRGRELSLLLESVIELELGCTSCKGQKHKLCYVSEAFALLRKHTYPSNSRSAKTQEALQPGLSPPSSTLLPPSGPHGMMTFDLTVDSDTAVDLPVAGTTLKYPITSCSSGQVNFKPGLRLAAQEW